MGKRSLRWLVERALDVKVWRPARAMLVRDQLIHLRRNEAAGYSDRDHLVAAAAWLARAQDARDDGGVSGRYALKTGWSSSYPETTGYLVPTFLALAKHVDPGFLKRAERCVRFLERVQLPDGAFPAGEIDDNRTRPSIFNSCQILHGLVAWHAATGDARTARAARRAADWVVAQQDADGAWRKHIYERVTTYTAHASCWLAEAGRHFGVEAWTRSAQRHLDWVMTHVDHTTGWIDLVGFEQEDHEQRCGVTHTLAYTLWGILTLSLLLGRADATAVARRAAERVARRLELSAVLPGIIDGEWKAAGTYACLTGNAQMALVWFRLAELDGDPRFVNAAIKAIDLVKLAQPMDNQDPGIRGGIPGSSPIWGDYIPLAFPSWGAKFFIDALIAKPQAVAAVMRHPSAAWRVPADVPRTVPAVNGSPPGDVKVVLLSGPCPLKAQQMIRSWAAWGFRPTTVIIEEGIASSWMTRLAARIHRNGIVMTLGHFVRKRTHRPAPAAAADAPLDAMGGFCEAEGIRVIRVASLSHPASVAAVRQLAPDLLVHAGAGILRSELLATARLGTVNAHMGILPHYRGMNVAEWSRLQSNPVGCTVHLIDPGIDTGDILVVEELDTRDAASVEELRELVDAAQIELLGRVVRFVVATGSLPPRRPQRPDEGRQYFRMHDELKAVLRASLASGSEGGGVERPR
jgi:hypothetical protein